MTLQKKIKLWKINLLHLMQNIKNISLESNFKSYEYKKFVDQLKLIHNKLNNSLDNLILCEHIHYFLKYNIKILLSDNIIHYIKNQKSFSYSNNIDQLYSNVKKYLIISNLIYIEIKKYIIDHKIFNEDSNKISNTNSIILILFFINYMSNKKIKINIKQIYKILDIKSSNDKLSDIKSNDLNNIQLIIYQINPFLTKNVENYYDEINSLMIRFPHSKLYTKYNIYPLIHNDQNDNTNIFTALNPKIINRLKTIENITYTSKEKKNDFDKNYHVDSIGVKISNHSFLKPAIDSLNTTYYPFGGINLYAKKYLTVLDNIILDEIKNDNIKIKEYFDNDVKQEISTPILYNIDLLLSTMLKEFKKQYDSFLAKNAILEYIDLFLLVVGKEYNHSGYIANSLRKIHNFECKKFILNAQIINPHINLKKFEKELKINQLLTINANGGDIWLSIRSEFSKHKIENSLKGDKLEQEKNVLQYIKIIFSQVLEQKDKLECIPNSLKLFGIIHHNKHRL
jgi:hypothetical protein